MEDETFKKVLDQQDQEFVRVLEDLIDILLQNGVVTLDMFPERAAEKIDARLKMRQHMRQAEGQAQSYGINSDPAGTGLPH
ncbi:MAG: hypothetical protein ACE363_15035 [Alphaproteobacteria bacterium]